jgi:hypothetical protein
LELYKSDKSIQAAYNAIIDSVDGYEGRSFREMLMDKTLSGSSGLRDCSIPNIHNWLPEGIDARMDGLHALWREKDAEYRQKASPTQIAYLNLWNQFRVKAMENEVFCNFLRKFYDEVSGTKKMSFESLLLKQASEDSFDVMALQEISKPLQARLEAIGSNLSSHGYVLLTPSVEERKDKKTWGGLLVKEALLPGASNISSNVATASQSVSASEHNKSK